MKKIGFVTPWFGENISGGAENALRELIIHFFDEGIKVEVLTTCVKDFSSNWNKNYYHSGVYNYRGITVRRFKIRKRDTLKFDQMNALLLQNKHLTREQELIFIQEMVNSPQLYQYIRKYKDSYHCYVYIPYMFGTTYYGILACPEKAVMIPCFHEESYLHMKIFKECFRQVKGMIFNAVPESKLANEVYDIQKVRQITPGLGMDTDLEGMAENFRQKYQIKFPFILYAGRKDEGKNIYTLLKYFQEYRLRNHSDLKLVLIGGGKIQLNNKLQDIVIDLGYVDKQDKYDAYAASLVLCQPSKHESFSYVIMESWLCGRPVLVHEECAVTRDFVVRSQGGLYFSDYFEFEGCINYLLDHKDISAKMGENGCYFVTNNFDWKIVMKKYIDFLKKL